MDDLVKRLREAARFHSSLKGRAISTVNDGAMEDEAADRIEALERATRDARAFAPDCLVTQGDATAHEIIKRIDAALSATPAPDALQEDK